MRTEPVEITIEYIDKHKTKRGAWTKKQVKALGLPWPLEAGWKHKLVGKVLTVSQANEFESAKNDFAQNDGKHIKSSLMQLTNYPDSQLLDAYSNLVREMRKRGIR